MSLRPLLDIAATDERFAQLSEAARGGGVAEVHMPAAIRPYLLAALVSSGDGLGDRPALIVAPDDIAARDLARDLRAYLAPRPVRHYPSRGTGYASHLAPPPHLVGLRIAALDSLSEGGAVVVASAVALAEAVPDASLRPAGFTLYKGQEVDLDEVGDRLVEAGYERADQVEERGQFAIRGDILDVFGATEDRAARLELFGDDIEQIRWFSTFTQRSLGDAEAIELSPAAELGSEYRELAELALSEEEGEGAGHRPPAADAKRSMSAALDLLPLDSFRAPLELIPDDTAVLIAAVGEMEAALRDHWEDATAAMHDSDARRLYVEVSGALADRASVTISDSDAGQELSFRAQAPSSAARSIGEAEKQLERELRSGYRVVVAFEHRGEAERARYNLERLEASFLDGAPPPDTRALLFA